MSFYVAATFSIPLLEVVSEDEESLEVCVTMETTAKLDTPVNLTLSTLSGTGWFCSRA